MRNETVSVVIRDPDLLYVGEDVEDRCDCCFARAPKPSLASPQLRD